MSQKPEQPSNDSGVQIFELTMDNPEDQDELNRRLRKPGEPESGTAPKNGHPDQAEPESGTAPKNGHPDQAEPTAEADRGRHPSP